MDQAIINWDWATFSNNISTIPSLGPGLFSLMIDHYDTCTNHHIPILMVQVLKNNGYSDTVPEIENCDNIKMQKLLKCMSKKQDKQPKMQEPSTPIQQISNTKSDYSSHELRLLKKYAEQYKIPYISTNLLSIKIIKHLDKLCKSNVKL